MLRGARKDPQIITNNWAKPMRLIDGLVAREVLHVPGNQGVLTEMFRPEWDAARSPVAQIFQIRLYPGTVSAWHCHAGATDRLFVSLGQAKIVCYDARKESATYGSINEFHVGEARPALVVVPPMVWHGVQALGETSALLVNAPSHGYYYEDPDHYRLPADTKEIPYRWSGPLPAPVRRRRVLAPRVS